MAEIDVQISGLGCAAYSIRMPHCEPSPSMCLNNACSCGVLMINTSRYLTNQIIIAANPTQHLESPRTWV